MDWQISVEQWLKSISSNPWFLAGGYATGILGLYLRIKSAIKSARKRKIPSYKVNSINVISGNHLMDNLQVTFKDAEIKSLTVSKVAIWNSGRETINASDIPEADPIHISPNLSDDAINQIYQNEIYNVEILSVTNHVNNIQVQPNTLVNGYAITFDYLDFKEGVLLKIIHSGKSSKDIFVGGTVKGFGKIVNQNSYMGNITEGFFPPSHLSYKTIKGNLWYSIIVLLISILTIFVIKIPFVQWMFILLAILAGIQVLVLLFYNPIPDDFDLDEDNSKIRAKTSLYRFIFKR
jgi:hypothetical protein